MSSKKSALKPTGSESAMPPIKLCINRVGEHGSEVANSAMLVIHWLTDRLRYEISKLTVTEIRLEILESPVPTKPRLRCWILEPNEHDGLIATLSLPASVANRSEIAETVIAQVVDLLTTGDVTNWPVLVRSYKDKNAEALKSYWRDDLFHSFMQDEDMFDLEDRIREDHRLCSVFREEAPCMMGPLSFVPME